MSRAPLGACPKVEYRPFSNLTTFPARLPHPLSTYLIILGASTRGGRGQAQRRALRVSVTFSLPQSERVHNGSQITPATAARCIIHEGPVVRGMSSRPPAIQGGIPGRSSASAFAHRQVRVLSRASSFNEIPGVPTSGGRTARDTHRRCPSVARDSGNPVRL